MVEKNKKAKERSESVHSDSDGSESEGERTPRQVTQPEVDAQIQKLLTTLLQNGVSVQGKVEANGSLSYAFTNVPNTVGSPPVKGGTIVQGNPTKQSTAIGSADKHRGGHSHRRTEAVLIRPASKTVSNSRKMHHYNGLFRLL
jgi:hypothetical protein